MDRLQDRFRRMPQFFRTCPEVQIESGTVYDTAAISAIRETVQNIIAYERGRKSAGTAAKHCELLRLWTEPLDEIQTQVQVDVPVRMEDLLFPLRVFIEEISRACMKVPAGIRDIKHRPSEPGTFPAFFVEHAKPCIGVLAGFAGRVVEGQRPFDIRVP